MNNQGENLTVIVITWNRLDFTKRTIESLNKTVPKAKLFIYDNGSDQNMLDYLSNIDGLKGIASENKGWGYAVNEALKIAPKNEFILLANNDVEFKDGWYEQALALYEKYPKIGILGLWKSPNHGVQEDFGDMVKKDQMPAVAWLLKPEFLEKLGSFAEHGPCLTKGGNGEDVTMCIRTEQLGFWVVGPKEDLAIHIGE